MHTFQYHRLNSTDKVVYGFRMEKLPESCPLCNTVQEPKFVTAYQLSTDTIEAVFQCNKKICNHLFISVLSLIQNGSSIKYIVKYSYPKKASKVIFEDEIMVLSPLFVEIYNQAKEAEDLQLNHVAGMGYRKSLEFLIKDFLINFQNEDEEKIKKTFLGNCIKEYLSANIRHVAERATWLGNDETHYHRVWENKDIGDLKILIGLTVKWIVSEIQTDMYIKEMDRK
ncbi:hypothetical protein [Rossellomorea sp. NRS-1567]|uniref:hypothetical protein n=1 Tax=Rossellomorea sp. NRS-1567 TaxID=3233901 RepID=UPI003D2B8F39